MMFSRFFRRSAALAAAAAIALQAFWPLLAQARPADFTLPVAICGVDGVRHDLEIRIGKTTPLEERSASHGEHCKLCVFGDEKAALNVFADPVLTPREASHKVVQPERQYLEQLQLLSAHPRAPPQAS
jgi:hypothetical protein